MACKGNSASLYNYYIIMPLTGVFSKESLTDESEQWSNVEPHLSELVMVIPSSSSTCTQYTGGGGLNTALDNGHCMTLWSIEHLTYNKKEQS